MLTWCVFPAFLCVCHSDNSVYVVHEMGEQWNRSRQMGLRGVEDIKCVVSVCVRVYVCR